MATITKTQKVKVSVSKVTEINSFPLTETKGFNKMFVLINGRDSIKFKSVRQNPNNRRVYFVTLFDHDLNQLRQTFSTEKISTELKKHNEFAVYKYQLK